MDKVIIEVMQGVAYLVGAPDGVEVEIRDLDSQEGECDKCNSPYDITSTDNRCGNCGNCSNCCTHKGESE
jgi:hypothetical protein